MSPEGALALAGISGVSRETVGRLERFVALLSEWNAVHNLLSREEVADVWLRHIADSAQLVCIAPGAIRWLDLGSGGGFPAVIIGCLLAVRPGAAVHLVESNSRKVAFLRAAKRVTGAPLSVHAGRIEDVVPALNLGVEAVTARALAPLSVLCDWAEPVVSRGAVAYFHKGADFRRELSDAALRWELDLIEHKSRIGSGVIVEIRSMKRRKPQGRR